MLWSLRYMGNLIRCNLTWIFTYGYLLWQNLQINVHSTCEGIVSESYNIVVCAWLPQLIIHTSQALVV